MQSQEQARKVEIIRKPYEPIHMSTCIKNNIIIYYDAIDNYSGKIVINDNGVIKVGGAAYKNMGSKFGKNDKLWWKVVESLYTQEYMKLPEGLKEIRMKEINLEISIIKTMIK